MDARVFSNNSYNVDKNGFLKLSKQTHYKV